MSHMFIASSHPLDQMVAVMKRQSVQAYYIVGITDQEPSKRLFSDSNILDIAFRKALLAAELSRLEYLFPEELEYRTLLNSQDDASVCTDCGALMVRTGTCYTCGQCGAAGGCG